ncbi:GAF domain-containing protein [Halocalculus aciditolerans]|uniref:Response regulatory domain-containing protein n=1 Tax=Halocalculus aciditolerans TaxID=1383812 RepID=A0A830FR55_9EURY|nr:GAF domain-containing protein [Halocalculus aciditolerans]GGL73276.1 hypothetical protein GCM10009039_34230 [Halocalculus aciditolerans]
MLLYVDPDPGEREATTRALADAGFETTACSSLDDARAVLDGPESVDCLVTEYDLSDGTGLELFRDARDATPDATCILYTDRPLDDIDTAAFGDVVADYLRKDDDAIDELVSLVEHSQTVFPQTAYPLPEDEGARVAALDRYTADPEGLDAALDRLTELAVALFDLDSAAVGLIDAHHERFLSCHGAAFDAMDREDTVCTFTILDDDVTVIEDLADDPRFEANQGLRDANIRFYAGAPLTTPDGHPIGVFCLHDSIPREFAAEDRERLRLLADEAMSQLDLHRRLDERGERDD